MQSCSRSSLGRWSMEVLRGSMERGFFFFSRLVGKSRDTRQVMHKNIQKHTELKLMNKMVYLVCLCSLGQWRIFFASQKRLKQNFRIKSQHSYCFSKSVTAVCLFFYLVVQHCSLS